jgi:hypothetical protein
MPKTALLSVLAPFNQPHAVDGDIADFLYALYQLLRNTPKSVSKHARKRTSRVLPTVHTRGGRFAFQRKLRHITENKNTEGLLRAHAMPQ